MGLGSLIIIIFISFNWIKLSKGGDDEEELSKHKRNVTYGILGAIGLATTWIIVPLVMNVAIDWTK
jgi:hypothetical protein